LFKFDDFISRKFHSTGVKKKKEEEKESDGINGMKKNLSTLLKWPSKGVQPEIRRRDGVIDVANTLKRVKHD
jgi:hypothetical protein